MKKILIIEDDPLIAQNILLALKRESNWHTEHSLNAQDGIKSALLNNFELIILDVGLPDESGFEVCKKIRKEKNTPIIFLTAQHEEIDRVLGLELGADDYVTKPFSPRELVARIKAILRRTSDTKTTESAILQYGPWSLNEAKKEILIAEKRLDLSQYEYIILCTLIRNPSVVFSREQFLSKISDQPSMSLDRSVDTHIKNIRSKLNLIKSGLENLIVTKRGFGYCLDQNLED